MWKSITLITLAVLQSVHAADVLSIKGFTNCNNGTSDLKVNNVDISFDKSAGTLTFDVSGTNGRQQEVNAELIVTAYGMNVFTKSFDPCDEATKVDQLCPVPQGNFAAKGTQKIPSDYISKIPSIAFNLPDIDAEAQMILKAKDGTQVACIKSGVTNGKTLEVPAVSYVAAAIAAGALVLSLVSAGATSGSPGSSTMSPGFFEVIWWFQGMAMNGMHSVNYPSIYRSFSKNFAFSTGLIPWGGMQTSIDNFRKATGGNLTDNSYEFLKNASLVYPDGSTVKTSQSIIKRSLLFARQNVETSVNGTSSGSSSSEGSAGDSKIVQGIQGYVEQLTIPEANTFMTVLMVFAIVIGVIVVAILLFKVILEVWALWGRFPKSLATFRKEYWRVMAQTIISLILLLYGVWTLYCIFQFTHGDSWAAQLLAGLTLGAFTLLLAFYTWKIWFVARKLKKMEGDAHALYDNKETWKKYRIFYENYKTQYWWVFMPFIVYMFAKGCVLAGADGHGLAQTVGQIVIEGLMLILLLWNRPYTRKSGNWINIVIQIVRVLSVVCVLVFVQELGVAKTTQTITGVVLIVVQASLTAILAILIAINSIITCCKENPHRKRRKAAQASRDMEGDAFLTEAHELRNHKKGFSETSTEYNPSRGEPVSRFAPRREDSQDVLVNSAAGPGVVKHGYHSLSQGRNDYEHGPAQLYREPTLPNMSVGQYRH